eukprot:11212034-Lingulodinium_polyedra.AAC.1
MQAERLPGSRIARRVPIPDPRRDGAWSRNARDFKNNLQCANLDKPAILNNAVYFLDSVRHRSGARRCVQQASSWT